MVGSDFSSRRGWVVVAVGGTTVMGPFMDKAMAERLAASLGPDHMVMSAAGYSDDADSKQT